MVKLNSKTAVNPLKIVRLVAVQDKSVVVHMDDGDRHTVHYSDLGLGPDVATERVLDELILRVEAAINGYNQRY